MHIQTLFQSFEFDIVFGRTEAMEVLDLKASSTSALLKKLTDVNIIEPVKGNGNGKYKFTTT